MSGPDGEPLPLGAIARTTQVVVPRALNRFGQLNSAKIQGALVPGVSIDAALKVLEQKAATILPGDYKVDYAGESRQLRKEQNALLVSHGLTLQQLGFNR